MKLAVINFSGNVGKSTVACHLLAPRIPDCQVVAVESINADNGQPVTASFMDYAMPRADDLPSFSIQHTMTLCPGNPLGVKGCGEAGAIGASAAVINAITDAIGHNRLEMPATPDRVWHAIHG